MNAECKEIVNYLRQEGKAGRVANLSPRECIVIATAIDEMLVELSALKLLIEGA